MPITMFMENTGGINITDSPMSMQNNQATGMSFNYDYLKTGAISKVLAAKLLNVVADSQLKSLGLGMHHSVSTDARTLIRAAGTKIQTYDPTTGITVNQVSDTAVPTSDFLPGTSSQPVVSTAFNTADGGTVLWMAGGGLTALEGYTGSNITQNGATAPLGAITTTVNTMDGGIFPAPGTYYYAVQFRKAITKALSNVSLDQVAVLVNADDTVTIDLTGITNTDATKYDQVIIWRSAFNGSDQFTTGSIIAELSFPVTTFKDTGDSIVDSQNTPRPGNTILDNSELPAGTYEYVTSFKRRLITVLDSTFYVSDLNKPESWPLENRFTVPSGGPITAIGSIGVPSEYTTGAEEYLCVWKDHELWVFTGDDADSWNLLFVDKTGAVGQSLVVPFNGYISWFGYNGIYIWNGHGRPSRISRPIAALFEPDGDLDKASLYQGTGCQYEKGNQVIWRVSHRIVGVNKVSIKMDTRLTSMAAAQSLNSPEIDGVFIFDTDPQSYYSICSFRPSSQDEQLVVGDDQGFVYQMFAGSTSAVSFDYETKPMDMGAPTVLKNFKRVLVYLEKLTPNDLTLYYWADYRIRDEYRSKVQATMEPSKGTQPALWDIALWDQDFFDDYTPDISPIEFNLHGQENNSVGLSLKLRFEQLEQSAPVRIHGFAIEWEPMSNLPKPIQQVV